MHESAAEAKRALGEMYGDDPKSNPDYSRIISLQAVDRLSGLIDPAKVVAGHSGWGPITREESGHAR